MRKPTAASSPSPETPADTVPEPRRGRVKSDLKRRAILHGAKAVFLAAGFEGANMDEVAARAGVSKMTVYRHFGSKEDLFAGVITEQRRVIARVLSEASDHPDVDSLHARAAAIDPGISIATVYRTVRLFEEAGILDRHDFGDGRARYEAAPEAHHDHMIDVETGKVIEFVDPELEALQRQIAEKLGYRLVDHRMELYGVKLGR